MWYLALALAIAVVPAFLPRRFAWLGYGFFCLVVGLILLEQHTLPSSEDNDRGLGSLLFAVWIGLGVASWAVRLALEASKPASAENGANGRFRFLSWPLPIGALLTVLALHWISNRLAGATPAWLVHLVIAGAAVGTAAMLMIAKPIRAALPQLWLTSIVTCACLALLVAKGAVDARSWARAAHREAGGRPYCLLTFAGRQHPQPVTSVLELSPLVSRSGGRSFADDAYWLVIDERDGPMPHRWQSPLNERAFFQNGERSGPAACTPIPGGNLR